MRRRLHWPGIRGARSMDEAALRAAIRAVILEELGEGGAAPDSGAPVVEEVTIRSDADLAALVQRVAALARTPEGWAELESGQRMFRLAGGARPARRGPVKSGLVSERDIDGIPEGVFEFVLRPAMRLTPLARDKLRARGIAIRREEP